MRLALFGVAVAARIASAQPAPGIEGKIALAHFNNAGVTGTDADAMFIRAPLWGVVIATDGPCTLRKRLPSPQLSAGPITITQSGLPTAPSTAGPSPSIELHESLAPRRPWYVNAAPVPNPAFIEGATINFEAKGGSDVPAFTASVVAPAPIAGFTPPTSLSRGGYTATWTPSTATLMRLFIGVSSPRTHDSLFLLCEVPDSGKFTVPASTFALVPPAFQKANAMAMRVSQSVQTLGDAKITVEALDIIGSRPIALTEIVPPPPPVEWPKRTKLEPPARLLFGFALGMGGVSRAGDVPPTGGFIFRMQVGARLRPRLHAIVETLFLPFDDLVAGAGVRWAPFAPLPRPLRGMGPVVDTHAFYLAATGGMDFRERGNTEAWSPMASLALGLAELQGRDWTLGVEFREQLAYFAGQLVRGWLLGVAVNLEAW